MLTQYFALIVILSTTSTGVASELYIITRANHAVPHSGAVVKFKDSSFKWLHFGVKDVTFEGITGKRVPGEIRTNAFDVNHVACFSIPEDVLRKAVRQIEAEYAGDASYQLNKCDCVDFTQKLALKCGLSFNKKSDLPITFFSSVVTRNWKKCIREKSRLNLDNKTSFVLPWER
mgnify:CR=1 FL=1|tara:strand:- start:7622 stop:8143 length:522 start_codon:yes stop_codon:yes gene_type:complete